MVAVSTAADELTPFPSGTSEATTILAPDVSGAALAREHDNDADNVGRPVVRYSAEHPPRLVVADGRTLWRERSERDRAGGRVRG